MKKFVISYLDFFDNALMMEKVTGTDKESVLRNYLFNMNSDWAKIERFSTMTYDELVDYALDGDLAIGVMEV